MIALTTLLSIALAARTRPSEVWTREQEDDAGFLREKILTPPPRLGLSAENLPAAFSWADQDGKSLVTKNLNQHIPQCARPRLTAPPGPSRPGARDHIRRAHLISPFLSLCRLWQLLSTVTVTKCKLVCTYKDSSAIRR